MNKLLLGFVVGLVAGAAIGWSLKPAPVGNSVAEQNQSAVLHTAAPVEPLSVTTKAPTAQHPGTANVAKESAPVAIIHPAHPNPDEVPPTPGVALSADAAQSYTGALRSMTYAPRDRAGKWEQPFFDEAPDDSWSGSAEDRVRAKVLGNVAAQRFPPKSIDCRRSACRLEYRFRNLEDYEAFDRDYQSNHIFPGTSIMGNGTNTNDGGQVYVEYIQRTETQP